jgi:hypothetical protein
MSNKTTDYPPGPWEKQAPFSNPGNGNGETAQEGIGKKGVKA